MPTANAPEVLKAKAPPPPPTAKLGPIIFGMVLLLIFGLAFAGFGSAAVVKGVSGLLGPKTSRPGAISGDVFMITLGSAFAVIGILSLIGAFLIPRIARRDAALAKQYPNQPWRWKRQWWSSTIRDSGKAGMRWLAIMTVLVNIVAWAATIGVFTDPKTAHDKARYAILIGPGIGLVLILWLIYRGADLPSSGAALSRWKATPAESADGSPARSTSRRSFRRATACISDCAAPIV